VSEETERAGSGPQGNGTGIDPTALALAMAGAGREEANAFLSKQGALIDDQRHHLTEQIKHLHLDIWEKRLGVWLRAATFCVGIAVAAGAGLMLWDAVHSNGLLIEPFAVPPDLAQRGLTGEVVAARLLDRLNELQAQTSSQRPPKSYAHSWGPDDIKIDIPETGVSLTQMESFLREKLGHDVHVSGEIVKTDAGLSLTVRAGAEGVAIAGQATEMEALLQKLAESVYRITQPYRYGIYLGRDGHSDAAVAVFRQLALSGPEEERPWGYNGWQFQMGRDADQPGLTDLVRSLQRKAVALNPSFVLGWENIAIDEDHANPEAALRDERHILTLLSGEGRDTIRPDAIVYVRLVEKAGIDRNLGAYADAAREDGAVVEREAGRLGGSAPSYGLVARDQAQAHDIGAARATLAEPVASIGLSSQKVEAEKVVAQLEIASQTGDWNSFRALAKFASVAWYRFPEFKIAILAYADARLGDLTAAEKEIAASPGDCYPCLITHARIAELRSQRARADYWFARAIQNAPSIPVAYADWGDALMARGQADAAIEKFKLANQKGPHFADPLEGWGEALMAKNQSHLALAKFAQADKYAPNWGRLHLKWGEALIYAGRRDEAKAQIARAAQLDLTPSEKAEMARFSHG
jgi:tetratricopeptide (TPR) repeat protein